MYRGKGGCDCRHTGYRGRAGIFELLLMTDEMRTMVVKHASATEILVVARRNGIKLMREDGWSKVLTGMTTVEEIQRVTKAT